MVDQFEVDQANFAGRLHPSQRAKVLGGALPGGVLMLVVATAIMVFLFTATASRFEAVYLAYMIPVYVLFLGGLWIVVRRVRDLSGGRVVAVTGWSGPEVPAVGGITSRDDNYGKKTLYDAAHQPFYRVRVGERQFQVDKKLYDRTPVNCTNTAFFTSCTKRILNVARTPGR
jgi:hypothetical protein